MGFFLAHTVFCIAAQITHSKKKKKKKKTVPEIWTKMLLVSQIAGFLNQIYLLKKMKQPDFFCMTIQMHRN